ncbi:MAG: hypothetical protein JO000_02685 [Alphaproteobacteria bacterium]|nr:hypothetical protein [Alphaproteobacteria bacterium]
MSNLVDVSSGSEPVPSRDMTIVALYCALAIAACFVLALYLDPANYVPVDPAAIGFFP